MNQSILQLQDLQIGFPQMPLGTPLCLNLAKGSRLGIIGSNGSGKTTLLKTLLGLVPHLSGSFHWEAATRFGHVPQESLIDEIYPLRTEDLLKMGLIGQLPRLKPTNQNHQKKMDAMLNTFSLEKKRKALFRSLSGGQKQRALLARALIDEPQVLLLDEPFNSLDYSFRKKIWHQLLDLQANNDLTLIIIEHDINRIINHVEYLIILGPRRYYAGETRKLLSEPLLIEAFETPLHLHEEDGDLQIHFL